MLRSTRPLLGASARGLPKTPASIAPFATSQPRKSPSTTTTWRTRLPSASSSAQLGPLAQRAQFAAKNKPDTEFEKEVAQKKLESHPELVTTESSVRASYEGPPRRPAEADTTEGVKRDVNRLVDTLSLQTVPPLVYKLGLAGTLPYLGTSLSTVYLSWDMNTEWPSQSQLLNHIMMSHENAAHYLHLLEPIQVGYGAIILSFLGAIHWGIEFAEKQPNLARTKFRYGLGVLAPIVAWPTMLMPVHYALITQFAAFTGLYFADSRATTRGWAPTWYATYRFVLTSIVGAAIFISLIGREKIGPDKPRLTGLREQFHKEAKDTLAEEKWEKLEEKEKAKNRKKAEEEEKAKKAEEEKQKKEEAKNKSKGGDKKGSKDESKDKKSEGKKDEGKKDEGNKDEGKQDEGKKDEGKKDEGKQDEGKKDEGKKDEGKKDEGKKDEGKKDEGKKDEGKKDEGKKDEGKNDEGKKDEGKEEGEEKQEAGDKKKGGDKKEGGDEKKADDKKGDKSE